MHRQIRTIISVSVAVAILVFLHYAGPLRPVENAFVSAVSPLQRGFLSMSSGLKGFYGGWLAKRDLLAENSVLREQLRDYQMDLSRINSLEEENSLLKDELGFVRESGHNYLAAMITTGVSDPLSQSVVINRGANDGLTRGLAVVAGKGIMVGKVSEVYGDFSKVLLLTDNSSKVAATIQNFDKTAGLVEGQFGLGLTMTNIPQDQEMKEGDLVVTSGLEGSIPKGILIAKVERVDKVQSEIFKTAMISPIISYADLSDVLVLMP